MGTETPYLPICREIYGFVCLFPDISQPPDFSRQTPDFPEVIWLNTKNIFYHESEEIHTNIHWRSCCRSLNHIYHQSFYKKIL